MNKLKGKVAVVTGGGRGIGAAVAKGGVILNATSSVGHKGRAFWGGYCVSKFALEGLTQVLAEELKDEHIFVYAVNPGGTRTRMRAQAYPKEDPATLPTPEEVAEVFVDLAANPDPHKTGTTIESRGLSRTRRS